MQLTRFSDLGLRVLMYLSHADREELVTIAEIATQFQIPHNHLIKVVNRLGKLGWILAARGRNGGLRLARPADTIRLGTVLREMEETTQLVDCDAPLCALSGHCLLKGALNAGLEAFYAKMDEYTLADVCKNGTGTAILTMHRHFLTPDSGAGRHA